MVRPQDEATIIRKLYDAGMIVLVPESDIPRGPDGKLLIGGLFSVPHKPETDRIINDRRYPNSCEDSLSWARLPHGCLLCQLIIGPDEVCLGSGDDLSNMFYMLEHLPNWIKRNGFGRVVQGAEFEDLGCKAGEVYVPCFRVVCMGDKNAVCIAQATHEQVLRNFHCLNVKESLAYRDLVPEGRVWEGLYIDDHLVVCIAPRVAVHRALRGQPHNCKLLSHADDLIDSSHAAYKHYELPRAENKAFRHERKFTAWGTQVSDQSGRVGAPVTKLRFIFCLCCHVLNNPYMSKKGMQKLLGLFVHPFQHRREFMSVWQEAYRWSHNLPESGHYPIPQKVRLEIIGF